MALNRRAGCAKTGVLRIALKAPKLFFRAYARKLILFLAERNSAKNVGISSLGGCVAMPSTVRPFLAGRAFRCWRVLASLARRGRVYN